MYLLVPVPSRLHGLSGYVLVPTLVNSARVALGDWAALPRIAYCVIARLAVTHKFESSENFKTHRPSLQFNSIQFVKFVKYNPRPSTI